MATDTYLCYRDTDAHAAETLRARLLQAGISVWSDAGLEPGTPAWKTAIRVGLEGAGCLVVLTTPAGLQSARVRAEIDFGRKRNKPVLFALLQGEPPADEVVIDLRSGDPSALVEVVRTVITPAPDVKAYIPGPFEWCRISAGQAHTHIDRGLLSSGMATFDLDAFLLAKYPVTVAQYAAFVDATDGFARVQNWDYSRAGRDWRRSHREPTPPVKSADDAPCGRVTWYEAMAYCSWLNLRLSESEWSITLPTEPQWVRAAQGDSDVTYPWGDTAEVDYCVVLEGQFTGPQPVTEHAQGASVYGVCDLSGNVWEWTLSEPGRSQVSLDGAGERILKGGAWSDPLSDARIDARFWQVPDAVDAGFGLRIAAERRQK